MKTNTFLQDQFSFSKLDCASKCLRKFFYQHVMKRKPDSIFMVAGRAVHKGMEADNLAKLAGERLHRERILEVATETYTKGMAEYGAKPETDRFVDMHRIQLEKFETTGIRDSIHPVKGGVEAAFELNLKIGNPETGEPEIPARVIGFIDVLSENPETGEKTVVDFKTTQKAFTDTDAKGSLQLALYSIAGPAEKVSVVSFVKPGRQKTTTKSTVPLTVTPETKERTLTWIADTLRAIRRNLKSGDFPKCSTACYWCSPKACSFYDCCYGPNPELKKLVQIEFLRPVGTVPPPEWRK